MSGEEEDPVKTIREVFYYEDIDEEFIKKSLSESDNNVLEAIKLINKTLFKERNHKDECDDDDSNDSDDKSGKESILNTPTIEEQLRQEQKGLFKNISIPSDLSSNSLDSDTTTSPSSSSDIDDLKAQLAAALERNKELETLLEQAQAEINRLKTKMSSHRHTNNTNTKRCSPPNVPFVLKGRWVSTSTIRYEWKYPPTVYPSSSDRIELHFVGSSKDTCADFTRATGSAEGYGSFNSLDVGIYVLKFVVDDKPIAVSDKIRIGDEVSVTSELDTVNNVVNVSYSRKNVVYDSNDKIVLYHTESKKVVETKNIFVRNSKGTTEGKITFTAPKIPGKYQIQYYVKKSKAYSGVSSFDVKNEDVIDVCLIPAQGTTFARVMWKCKAFKRSSNDWVGLYPAGPAASYRCYEYVKGDEGSATFDLYSHKFGKGDTIVAKFFVNSYSKTEPVLTKEFVLDN